MSRGPITHQSEQDADYCDGIGEAATLKALLHVLHDYATLYPDALAEAPRNAPEFKAWREGLDKERKGEFAGLEFMQRFGAVLLPDVLVAVGVMAQQCGVPWGCAYIRMREAGHIEVRNQVSYVARDTTPRPADVVHATSEGGM